MENKTKKSLLNIYGIPVHHLDFKYIKDCKDGREMEKIVHILRSNEEGYFPDLTACAEQKLKELKPQSRLFRVEEQIKGREALEPDELKPIYDWNKNIKTTDEILQKLIEEANTNLLPPIRKGGSILQNTKESKNHLNTAAANNKENKPCQRIKSTDYEKWEQYDPEEEILRLDLAEERKQEETERKNRECMDKFIKKPLTITEIKDNEPEPLKKWAGFSEIEKEKLSEEYRIRGNEYFRSKEYDVALQQYTSAIECTPLKALAAYNNRALTYFKQQKFLDSIKDCEQALKLEPTNLKARLRLAEANYAFGRRRESYPLYINVLQLDAQNEVALKATAELRKQFEDLPPPNATRLKIQDEPSVNVEKTACGMNPKEKSTLKSQPISKPLNYDLADLVKPNRIVQNKLFKAAENLGKTMTSTEKDVKQQNNDGNVELRLSAKNETKARKKLIEEI